MESSEKIEVTRERFLELVAEIHRRYPAPRGTHLVQYALDASPGQVKEIEDGAPVDERIAARAIERGADPAWLRGEPPRDGWDIGPMAAHVATGKNFSRSLIPCLRRAAALGLTVIFEDIPAARGEKLWTGVALGQWSATGKVFTVDSAAKSLGLDRSGKFCPSDASTELRLADYIDGVLWRYATELL